MFAPEHARPAGRDPVAAWQLLGMLGFWSYLALAFIATATAGGLDASVVAFLLAALALSGTAGLLRHRTILSSRLSLFSWPVMAIVGQTIFGQLSNEAANLVLGVYVLTFLYVGVTQPVARSWWLVPVAALSMWTVIDLPASHALLRVALAIAVWLLVACWPAHLLARVEHQRGQLERLASTDALTGLRNRTRLTGHLDAIGRESALLLIDLDHFKRYNDEHGHLAGDLLLQEFADLLTRHSRDTDAVYRFGGEEFLVVLADTQLNEAAAIANRLAAAWADHSGGLSFSAGIASAGSRGLMHADALLYEAKRAGRAQVITSPTAAA